MAGILIRESSYVFQMETKVEPYLARRRKELSVVPHIYCAFYEASRPRGTVIICHGFTENAEKYAEIIYYFLRCHYHVYIPEHCGHGRSYRLTDDPSLVHIDHWQRYVEDFLQIARLAKRSHPELPLILFGHSMGGGIGAAAAAREPGLFRKIILSSPMIRPLTGTVPYHDAIVIAASFCRAGKSTRYVAGQHPYSGNERFEDSSAVSKARYTYHHKKREAELLFQTNAASYGWLYQAALMHRYLRKTGWKKIQAPMLVFQADREHLVSKRAQENFVRKIACRRGPYVRLIPVPGSKHEIFNSGDRIVAGYWRTIFSFLRHI